MDPETPVRLEYDDQTYVLRKGVWYDTGFLAASNVVQNKLNALYSSRLDYSSMTLSKMLAIADGYKASESYDLAIQVYQKSLTVCSVEDARYILPRITSCYRSTNQSHKAIAVNHEARQRFGMEAISPALLTSIAAAYCDILEYENARKCCDWAYAMLKGKSSPELSNVYGRIEKEQRP
ncbi:MAG: hypothetical protein VB051_06325 [Candidatus Pelethousia sp.]|nr:hypothetical protein [Candidatus Pelethousia sp.]